MWWWTITRLSPWRINLWNDVVSVKSLEWITGFYQYVQRVYGYGYPLCFMLGMALDFILKNNFKQEAGLRPRARKIGVLITDGKSQDDVVTPSRRLRDEGVELYAIGKYYMKRWPVAAPSHPSAKCIGKWKQISI